MEATRKRGGVTLEDVREMKRDIITPFIAAQILKCDPQYIRIAARDRPEVLGFAVARIGSRTKIPRRAFIAWCEGAGRGATEGGGEA